MQRSLKSFLHKFTYLVITFSDKQRIQTYNIQIVRSLIKLVVSISAYLSLTCAVKQLLLSDLVELVRDVFHFK